MGQFAVRAGLGLAVALSMTVCASAQTAKEIGPSAGGRILLVLPFDNRTGQPSLEWVREAAPQILGAALPPRALRP